MTRWESAAQAALFTGAVITLIAAGFALSYGLIQGPKILTEATGSRALGIVVGLALPLLLMVFGTTYWALRRNALK